MKNDLKVIVMHILLCQQANAIGRSAKTVREFLEKHYSEEVASSDDETIKLAIKALLEVGEMQVNCDLLLYYCDQ